MKQFCDIDEAEEEEHHEKREQPEMDTATTPCFSKKN
jgi:hypothetical protein